MCTFQLSTDAGRKERDMFINDTHKETFRFDMRCPYSFEGIEWRIELKAHEHAHSSYIFNILEDDQMPLPRFQLISLENATKDDQVHRRL